MKKLYFLLTLFTVMATFGQTPIITMIADGDETSGTPKVLEIYAHGTVDFTLYSLENQTNSSATWGNTFDLSPLGTVTDSFVYIYTDTYQGTSTAAFAPNFPAVTASNSIDVAGASVLSINGDDRVRIVVTSTSSVIDIYGVDGADGSGTAWEYKDGYAKRLNSTGPDPAFIEANWSFHNGELNTHGSVQDGTTYESIIGLATFTPSTSTTPSLTITAPGAGQVLPPNNTNVDVVFTVQNYTIGSGMGEGHIVYTVDGGSAVDKFDTTPIALTSLTHANHTVNMEVVDENGAPLSPALTATVTFSITDYIDVADVAALRAGTIDGYYNLTGEAFAIAQETYNSGSSNLYVQDATGGIKVYIPNGITTTVINTYDGITGLKGQLSGGTMKIELIEDFTLTGNNTVQTPQVVTIADFNANFINYESELIEIDGGVITGFGSSDTDTEFTRNHNYHFTVGTDETIIRTSFTELTNASVAIPAGTVNVIGVAGAYNGVAQVYPRKAADIVDASGAISNNQIDGFKVYPNPVSNGQVFVTTNTEIEKQVVIYDILGKVVLSTEANNNQAINISQLKSGIYMMKVIEEGHVALHKLMIK